MQTEPDLNERSPLYDVIRDLITSSGPMPVWRYMDICLTHPQHGYYIGRDPLGRSGDFTTSPEVSQMFGELVGLWAASVWRAMGSPPFVQLIELGPGRGTMMADVLRALKIVPPMLQALHVHMVEINPVLRRMQQERLADARSVRWHRDFDSVPAGPSIILANEYFDVLPIHQMVKQDTGWHERTVELNADGVLTYGLSREAVPQFEKLLPEAIRAAKVGAIFEWRSDSEMMKIATRVRDEGGAALLIDYGHIRSDVGDTFQAMRKHEFIDALETPGLADLTAHVDFQALARASEDVGARVHGPVSQGEFLNGLGIQSRATTLLSKANPDTQNNIIAALNRLTDMGRGGMGSMFKVLGVSDPAMTSLAALSDRDPAK